MKNNKFLRMALPFLVGAVFGLGVWALYSFSQVSITPPDPPVTRISVTDAHTYSQNYYNTATASNSKIKGFNIDKAGVTTMNTILGAAPTAAGFRVYFGTDASGARLWIICGVDSNGSDMTGNIYSAKSTQADLCPWLCDASSPIPGQ
jgi:hypothetical protein